MAKQAELTPALHDVHHEAIPGRGWHRHVRLINIALISIVVGLLYARFPFSVKTPDQLVRATCSHADRQIVSCSAQSEHVDACCVERPNGVILLTQMWNWNSNQDLRNQWSTHGLWGNTCNGSYVSYCDKSREQTDIPALLKEHRRLDLLDAMQNHWKNDPPVTTVNGSDQDLWAHEWNKHGTCFSTLEPHCSSKTRSALMSSKPISGLDAVQYFDTTLELSTGLPTFDILSRCGFSPDADRSYRLSLMEECLLNRGNGHTPRVVCDPTGRVNEIWWYFKLRGPVNRGGFESTPSLSRSNCPEVIRYMPKV